MSELTEAQLATTGQAISMAAAEARSWVRGAANNSARVRTEASDLVDAALRAQTDARRLARAAERRMCVGVFGPSQAGKSYLLSRLARQPGLNGGSEGRLVAQLGEQTLDFLQEINPPGDKESTGLVTRFTREPIATPAGFPVAVRLFSETDLVRVFANSYFLDFDHHNLEFEVPKDPDSISALLGELEGRAGDGELAHLDELAIFELRDYFLRNFKTASEFLGPCGYWDAVTRLAPRLGQKDRSQLFSVLWGGIDEFTALFDNLLSGLAQLGFASDAYVSIDALTPRDRSIIDVDRIKLELGTAADTEDTIRATTTVMNEAGREAALPRATLCALVAELKLQMRNETWPLLSRTDLLDFPGARSREKYRRIDEQVESELEMAARPRELFIRGKVAMLFQRYSEERELTSMLLCMGPSNSEVKDLGLLVRGWIDLTQGDSPSERARQPNTLFLVLTKSDADFITKEGEDESSQRAKWERRMFASIREPYSRDRWVDEWDLHNGEPRPFRNVLWLRNPGIRQPHMVTYEGSESDRREAGYSPEFSTELPKLKQYFLDDNGVSQHFIDPEAAFDALLKLNDGGVEYLIGRLDEVLDESIKQKQVSARLEQVACWFNERFVRFFESHDAESRVQKREAARGAAESIGAALAHGRFREFGLFLRDLSAQPAMLYNLYLNIAANIPAGKLGTTDVELQNDGAKVREVSVFDEDSYGGEDSVDGGIESQTRQGGTCTDPRISDFAQRAVSNWIQRVRETAAEPGSGNEGMNYRDARMFAVEQVVMASHRVGLVDQISEAMHERSQVISTSWEHLGQLGAIIASNCINALVATLGYAERPAADRPPVPPEPEEPRRRAFEQPATNDGLLPILGMRRRSIERDFALDWLASMVQLTTDNAGFSKGRDITEEQNEHLGKILEQARYPGGRRSLKSEAQ